MAIPNHNAKHSKNQGYLSEIDKLFLQWKAKQTETKICPESAYNSVCEEWNNIAENILFLKPQSMRDLAIQVLVQTDEGDDIAFANGGMPLLVNQCKELTGAY